MSSVPSDLYHRVLRLATDLTNASEAGDDLVYGEHLSVLKALYEEQRLLGASHPFLTEALADYSDDPEEAAALYLLAIDQATNFADETTHTKHISLAEALISLGRLA